MQNNGRQYLTIYELQEVEGPGLLRKITIWENCHNQKVYGILLQYFLEIFHISMKKWKYAIEK